jgi:uncharacterized protein YecT (DUF1311 family)
MDIMALHPLIRTACLAILPALLSPQARADACMDKAVSQSAMNECAGKSYEASNAALNKLYQQIVQRLHDDDATKKLLVSAQRAWLSFRDAECKFSASSVEGGTAYPMAQALCFDGLTSKRVDDLKSYLACKEGEINCPVPPGK